MSELKTAIETLRHGMMQAQISDTGTTHVEGEHTLKWLHDIAAELISVTPNSQKPQIIELNAMRELATHLTEALACTLTCIEHSQANSGKVATHEQWYDNVDRFREHVSHIGTGRSYVDEASVPVFKTRDLVLEAQRALGLDLYPISRRT